MTQNFITGQHEPDITNSEAWLAQNSAMCAISLPLNAVVHEYTQTILCPTYDIAYTV